MLFWEALFLAPREGPPPVTILRTAAERDRASSGYAQDRRELERRLRARFPAYTRAALGGDGARHATYDECAAERADEGRGGTR